MDNIIPIWIEKGPWGFPLESGSGITISEDAEKNGLVSNELLASGASSKVCV